MSKPTPTIHRRLFTHDGTPYPACLFDTTSMDGVTTMDPKQVNCRHCRRLGK